MNNNALSRRNTWTTKNTYILLTRLYSTLPYVSAIYTVNSSDPPHYYSTPIRSNGIYEIQKKSIRVCRDLNASTQQLMNDNHNLSNFQTYLVPFDAPHSHPRPRLRTSSSEESETSSNTDDSPGGLVGNKYIGNNKASSSTSPNPNSTSRIW